MGLKYLPVFASTELRHLLEGLAAGATRAMFTPDDWAFRLGDDPSAHQFIGQLRREWQPVLVPDAFCQQIMDFAIGYLEPYAGWPHLWAHTLRVTGNAVALSGEAGIEPVHAFLLGILHDVGKLDEMHNGGSHEQIGADIARVQLRSYLDRKTVLLITNVIAKKSSPLNPYTQVMHDADKLDKIGATGIVRRISTNTGTHFTGMALNRVEDDLRNFPAMHFDHSRHLYESKKTFTEAFLGLILRAGSDTLN